MPVAVVRAASVALADRPTAPPSSRTHRRLLVWQRAVELCVRCHALAAAPAPRRAGLGRRLCDAASLVPASIAHADDAPCREAHVEHLWAARHALRVVETMLVVLARLPDAAGPRGDRPSSTGDPAAEAAALDALCADVRRLLAQRVRAIRPAAPRPPPGADRATAPTTATRGAPPAPRDARRTRASMSTLIWAGRIRRLPGPGIVAVGEGVTATAWRAGRGRSGRGTEQS